MEHPSVEHLDLCGLKCPQPVLRTRKRLRALQPGTDIIVRCTDPLAVIDVPNLVREMGAHVLAKAQDGPVSIFHIRVGSPSPSEKQAGGLDKVGRGVDVEEGVDGG